MSEQRWVLRFEYGSDRTFRHGYAQRNPATGVWAIVDGGFVQYATTFPSRDVAIGALVRVRPQLHGSPWLIPADAWEVLRVGDLGEPLTRFHEREAVPASHVSAA